MVADSVFLCRKFGNIVGYIAYIILHGLTHGAAMQLLGGIKVQFGFTGLYAYAGSESDYFGKIAYRIIALAPLTVKQCITSVGFLQFRTESITMLPEMSSC